jgi:hypothetical protein
MVALEPDHGLEPYYRRELLSRWSSADAATRRRGKQWYPAARAIMEEIAADTGYTLAQAVAVMAITSPGVMVSTNVRWTRDALESRGSASVGRFPNRMRPKIAAVLADPVAAEQYVNGPKVGAFFRAILGADELVLDRWAIFAATGTGDREENHKLRRDVRAAMVTAYKRAARQARCTVRDFQAAVWIATRESTPVLKRGRYTIPRLADITS